MPWRETCQMDERTQFIARVLAGEDEMTALCREYGISRKTGYEWLGRYRCEGAAGLRERSHAPLRHGQAHDVTVVQAVLALRERWRHWGPKKLRVKLRGRARNLWSAGSAPCVLRDSRFRGLLRMRNFLNAIKALPSS